MNRLWQAGNGKVMELEREGVGSMRILGSNRKCLFKQHMCQVPFWAHEKIRQKSLTQWSLCYLWERTNRNIINK